MPIRIDKTNNNNFANAFLSQQLFKFAEEYYITTRMIYSNYDILFMHSIIHNGAECLEKVIKFYLSVKEKNFKYENLKDYSHRFDKLLEAGLKINRDLFSNKDLTNFAKQYSDLGNQLFRYGLNSDYKKEFVGSYGMDINKFIIMLDNIFLGILSDLILNEKRIFLELSSGEIAQIFNKSPLSLDLRKQFQKDKLQQYIVNNNLAIDNYLKKLDTYISDNFKKEGKQ